VAHLATAFADLGHQVELIYNTPARNASPLVVSGVTCLDVFPSWGHPGSLLSFWAALKKSAPDLIYARLPNDFLWMVNIFTRLHPKARFMYALANDRECSPWQARLPNSWFHNSLYAVALRNANIVAVQHEEQAPLVSRYTHGKITRVPNLVHRVAPEIRQRQKTDIDVIWIAQIRPQKQLSILLDAAEQLPQLQFAVVGGFADARSQTELTPRMEGLQNVRYFGPIAHEEVMQVLARSRVIVNTSCWEGFPNTMLEAWSLGVPVVSLQIDPGGVICRERIGLLSKTQEQMVDDIKKLVEEGSLNDEMGKRGQEYVRSTHGIEAVCRAFDQVVPGVQIQ